MFINQIYNQQDQRQSSSNNTIMNESITDVGGAWINALGKVSDYLTHISF